MALFISHYLDVVGALQVVGGLLLFTGRWTPLGLTLVGPVIVNIVCFHALMAPAGLPMAIVVSALALFLLWNYRRNFAGILVDAPAQLDSHGQPVTATTATVHS